MNESTFSALASEFASLRARVAELELDNAELRVFSKLPTSTAAGVVAHYVSHEEATDVVVVPRPLFLRHLDANRRGCLGQVGLDGRIGTGQHHERRAPSPRTLDVSSPLHEDLIEWKPQVSHLKLHVELGSPHQLGCITGRTVFHYHAVFFFNTLSKYARYRTR